METRELHIEFGRDQEAGADNLLDEMTKEGKVLLIEKKPAKAEERIHYTITFDNAYSVYVFGYRSASLWKYATEHLRWYK